MTRAELSELGLENLIGTEALKAYMHGYFMDNKLYQRAKMVAKPSMYEEYQKEKNRKKDKERKEKRITMNHKKPEVNAELAAKWEKKEEAQDERFSALFKNEDFQIDKNSEDFRRSHASGFGRQSREEEEESEAAAESDVFSEDFELLNTHDGENREKKESEEEAESSKEEAYVGKKKRKEKEEKDRIKPKGVRFYGVKENSKINLATGKKEMEKEVEKRKEKRTMSLGKRVQGLEK